MSFREWVVARGCLTGWVPGWRSGWWILTVDLGSGSDLQPYWAKTWFWQYTQSESVSLMWSKFTKGLIYLLSWIFLFPVWGLFSADTFKHRVSSVPWWHLSVLWLVLRGCPHNSNQFQLVCHIRHLCELTLSLPRTACVKKDCSRPKLALRDGAHLYNRC